VHFGTILSNWVSSWGTCRSAPLWLRRWSCASRCKNSNDKLYTFCATSIQEHDWGLMSRRGKLQQQQYICRHIQSTFSMPRASCLPVPVDLSTIQHNTSQYCNKIKTNKSARLAAGCAVQTFPLKMQHCKIATVKNWTSKEKESSNFSPLKCSYFWGT